MVRGDDAIVIISYQNVNENYNIIYTYIYDISILR